MPAATSKDRLLDVTEKEFTKLDHLLEQVPAGLATAKDDDDTSIKDMVAHRAHWIQLFFGWYRDGLDGKEVAFPAPGYKWNQLKEYNRVLRQQQKDLGWQDAKQQLRTSHQLLLRFIEDRSDDQLYGGPMVGANNNWTPGRWAEAAGPSHYRSAAKYIRKRLKEQVAT